jgi:hypothetical protein
VVISAIADIYFVICGLDKGLSSTNLIISDCPFGDFSFLSVQVGFFEPRRHGDSSEHGIFIHFGLLICFPAGGLIGAGYQLQVACLQAQVAVLNRSALPFKKLNEDRCKAMDQNGG